MARLMYRFPILLALHFCVTIPCAELIAQRQRGGSVSGRISDADSGKPVEGAIVFLPNTPLGVSSGNDGRFAITNVPAGTYQLAVSHIGFKEKIMSVRIANGDSLSYEIKLETEPVRMREVEIPGKRVEETTPSPGNLFHFFPTPGPNTYCMYVTGPSMPIGIFFSDSAFYMYSLDTATVDSEKYLRMWLLYKNQSQTPYLLDPMKCLRLHMQSRQRSFSDILPTRPSKMLESLDNRQAIDEVSEKIGKALQALALIQTSSSSLEEYFIQWGAISGPFYYMHGKFAPSREGSLSADLHAIFTDGINSGILGRYTVYPNNSVNGFIYFPFPGLRWNATTAGFSEAAEYVYTVELITPTGSKLIQFTPR
jgi:hypothetical protein